MTTKDIILIIATIVGVLTGVAGFIYAVIQNRRNRRLEAEKQQRENEDRQYRQQRDKAEGIAQDLKPAIAAYEESNKKATDAERYKSHVAEKFKYLNFTGLNAILQKPLELKEIYVKLKAKQSYGLDAYHSIKDFQKLEQEFKETPETDKAESNDRESEGFVDVFRRLRSVRAGENAPLKMVVLGRPGSGKTTLMKWLALQCIGSDLPVFKGLTPVFVPLKNLAADPGGTFKSKNIRDLIPHLLKVETPDVSFFRQHFEANQILFLLDGLDEVADEGLRRDVIRWIQKQDIRQNALLVTSRFSGMHEAKGLKFHDAVPMFAIRDFEMEDIECFLENWYRNIEFAVAGPEGGNDVAQKGKKQYEDLMAVIKSGNQKTLRRLAVNPLLLTIIAIVHRTRAVLPKERHKLYEECLKVMIELWNVANRNIDVSFSVENSIMLLSRIAKTLMEENRREMDLPGIRGLLPEEIEGCSREVFLKEMVLKAGLLYESEGKYGFLHLTFQEYLAAYYYAGGENVEAILEHRDKDYWTETFKLFANIGNTKTFFSTVMDGLLEKEYWRNMQLWDDCLKDVSVEVTRKEIELKFAKRVAGILPTLPYEEKSEELIIQLNAHYPLYSGAKELEADGWRLFEEATHPFVQSVGASVLIKMGGCLPAQLMERLKEGINRFERQEDKSDAALLDFMYRNNNSFVLLIGRGKPLDFNFALAKLKS
ncbi:MAG: NACHT domain-containing protein, partial [bacterium]|nr:NACHT domain-containing protein [bacterium]